MTKKDTGYRRFSMRIPEEMWLFYRKVAFDNKTSMMEIIINQLDKYQRKMENKASHSDTCVSE